MQRNCQSQNKKTLSDGNKFTHFCRYFFSLAYISSLFPGILIIQPASYFINACSTPVLRSTNAFLAVICSILVYDIIKSLKPSLDDKKATLYTVVLALYPLHWFFTFLYYTDVASLTVVLAMYLMCLKKNYLSSALVIVGFILNFVSNITSHFTTSVKLNCIHH